MANTTLFSSSGPTTFPATRTVKRSPIPSSKMISGDESRSDDDDGKWILFLRNFLPAVSVPVEIRRLIHRIAPVPIHQPFEGLGDFEAHLVFAFGSALKPEIAQRETKRTKNVLITTSFLDLSKEGLKSNRHRNSLPVNRSDDQAESAKLAGPPIDLLLI